MPETITWALQVKFGGIVRAASNTIDVEAYDKLQVTIGAASGGTSHTETIAVQPCDSDQVHFLLITADSYKPALTYTVDGSDARKLDAPLVMLGAGAVGILGAKQQSFKFSNSDAAPHVVEILVGRKATTQ